MARTLHGAAQRSSLIQNGLESAPRVVASSILLRLLAALVPLAILAVTKVIIDCIYNLKVRTIRRFQRIFWWLVGLEFALASLAMISARVIDFCDGLLADKFTRYINIRIMEHTSSPRSDVLRKSIFLRQAGGVRVSRERTASA